MASYQCPSCGKPYNGKKCRSCLYETFTEEIGHGLHTHRGEPLVIDAPVRRPIRRKNPFVWDKRTRTRKNKFSWVGVALVLIIVLAEPVIGGLVNLLESAGNAAESVVRVHARPEPESWPDQMQVTMPAEGTVLLDRDGIRVAADWQDGDEFDGQIRLVLENNTDRPLWLTTESIVVNGFVMQYGSVYAWAEPGQTEEGYFYLDEQEVLDAGITQFQEISFQMEVVDDETYDLLLTQPVTFRPQCEEDYVQETLQPGTVLLDQDGVLLSYQGYEPDYSLPEEPCYGSLKVYLENNTDYALGVYTLDAQVNGKKAEVYLWADLPAHSRCLALISLYDLENLKITSWDQLETVTLTLEIGDWDTEQLLLTPEPITIAVHGG